MAEKTYTVLVLCTGNSCRSQMAEVLLNHDLAGQVRALSAGTRPQPKVADGAIAALKAAGLPTDGLHPKDMALSELHVEKQSKTSQTRPILGFKVITKNPATARLCGWCNT